jgi:Zn-dependent protease with chaperone function
MAKIENVFKITAAVFLLQLVAGVIIGFNIHIFTIAIGMSGGVFVVLLANSAAVEDKKYPRITNNESAYKISRTESIGLNSHYLLLGLYIFLVGPDPSKHSLFLVIFSFMQVANYLASSKNFSILERDSDGESRLHEIAADLIERSQRLGGEIFILKLPRIEEEGEIFHQPQLLGFGKSKRIFISQALMDQFSNRGVRGLLAHQLAHLHRHHDLKTLAICTIPFASLVIGIEFFAISSLAFTSISFLIALLLQGKLLRALEYAADRQGAKWVGKSAMIECIEALPFENSKSKIRQRLGTHPPNPHR